MLFVNSADDTRIATWRGGAGQPLLMVHGSSVDHTHWIPVREALEGQFDVWLMDRRGRGESGDSASYSLQREAEDIAAVAKAIGAPVTVFGHSYGGLCALEAAMISSNIHQLISYEAPAPWCGDPWTDDMDTRMQAFLDAGQPEEGILVFAREFAKIPPDGLAGLRALPIWRMYIDNAHSLLRELRAVNEMRFNPERLRNIQIPVSILVGGVSPPNFHESAKTLHAGLSHSRLRVVEGYEHLSFLADPKGFVALLQECMAVTAA